MPKTKKLAVNKLKEGVEMEPLSPVKKNTRFQVKKVLSITSPTKDGNAVIHVGSDEDSDDDPMEIAKLNSKSEATYAKSFRHMTREALPRLDNYRNIMSYQAAKRPTLDELHNATLTVKLQGQGGGVDEKFIDTDGQLKFGWIKGVLIRCILSIWGVMLFLRLSWVVSQSGIGEGLLLIFITSVVTTVTALSMSAISTNGIIKGGGTYYMISRSLGPGFGGSIGLVFSLANAVAAAMNVVGFCETLGSLLRKFDLQIVDGGVQDIRINGLITIVVLTLIVIVGMEWEAKAQIALLVILVVAIFDFIIGSIIGPTSDEARAKGFIGYNLSLINENFFSAYTEEGNGEKYNFFKVFAIFFPSATGILAGANISGDLRDPQKAIPKGTLLAILITTVVYMLIAVLAGAVVVRDATGSVTDYFNGTFRDCLPGECLYGLHNNAQIIELVAWIGPLIYAGCFAATLSSALASLVSAPKVFQALCNDKLYPYIEWFGKGYGQNNEPIRGYILCFFIVIGFVLIGELNLIAPLISNFFLAAYTLINFATFHASLVKPIGWRPTFKYYNMWLSLFGSIMCVFIMFLISWWNALITMAVLLALYLIVCYRKPDVNWGSTTQAQSYKEALKAVYSLNLVEEHVKNYRPQILVLSGMPSSRPALVDFANLLTKNMSLLVCGNIIREPISEKARMVLNANAYSWLEKHKIKAFYTHVDGLSFKDGAQSILKSCGIGKLKPNILLMGYKTKWSTCPREDLDMYFDVLHIALDCHMGVGILRIKDGIEFSKNLYIEERIKDTLALPRNQSYGQMSYTSSVSNLSGQATPLANKKDIGDGLKSSQGIIVECSDEEEEDEEEEEGEKKEEKSLVQFIDESKVDDKEEVPQEILDEMFPLRKGKPGATIDVWWLYDDGGKKYYRVVRKVISFFPDRGFNCILLHAKMSH
ncbi:solute carrier family 12 member 2-like [Agrilus planipennis]|uniref:Solute carrier family 12 member 2-like n=1 Tax=Agrilus planipennis TaxID=224129 RepID=A0A7F5QWN8_AGRPL|nr:solute carrier family 12 member 2-like [Agrilus planipennis]